MYSEDNKIVKNAILDEENRKIAIIFPIHIAKLLD
jgi:hypothetical protein